MKFASLPAGTALRLMLAFGFGFFLSMFTRAVSNMVKQPIQLELGLNEEAISLALGASFFLTFALVQLPVGILLDRYDPRKVNGLLFLLAALGATVMALSDSVATLTLGRICMGVGFSAAMMASLKVYALWFPVERLPTINSLQFMIGVLGAWSATKPVELMLRVMDWRELYLVFASITVLAGLLMVLVAPRHEADGSRETLAEQLRGLGRVYADAYFWRIAPWMCVSVGVAQGVGTLYLFSWFTDVAAFPVPRAANGVALVTLISAANLALIGPLAEALNRRGFGPMAVPVVGQCLAMTLLVILSQQVQTLVVPQWMIWTICSGTSTLAFAALSQAFPGHLMGRVYTAFNLMSFLATAVSQWIVGIVLDSYPRMADGGAAPEGYQAAFLLLVSCQLLAAMWYAFASWRGIGNQTMLMKSV